MRKRNISPRESFRSWDLLDSKRRFISNKNQNSKFYCLCICTSISVVTSILILNILWTMHTIFYFTCVKTNIFVYETVMYFAVNSYLILIAVTLDIMLKYTWSTWRQGYNKWNPKPLAITVITNFMREGTFTKLFLSKLSFNRKKNLFN